MSFKDSTVGGGIDLVFDPAILMFIDGVFSPIDCTLNNGPNFVSFGGLNAIRSEC